MVLLQGGSELELNNAVVDLPNLLGEILMLGYSRTTY